jgi:hypothetical protein
VLSTMLSPSRSHAQLVAGMFDVSVNCTVYGPMTWLVKFAVIRSVLM